MKRSAPLLFTTLLLSACVSSSDLQKLSNQISDVQDDVAALKREASSKDEVEKVNSRLAQQTTTILKSAADVTVKIDQMDEKLQNTQGSIEQSNYRIDKIVQQLTGVQRDVDELKMIRAAQQQATTGQPMADEVTVQAPPAPASPAGQDPLQTYQGAFRDYQRGNYDLAIAGFSDYLKSNPNTDLSDNALYWIGESLFSQKKYREAIEQFDSVITRFPKSAKVSGALLKKGLSYIETGQKAQGIVQLQYVVHEHSTTQEASLARQKLKSLGIDAQ
ncbi:MAG TPA: tol-pal system protein YbgF [Thermoanaerobaculia bacterium]|nr:tol-pal system protein YbgF [Thermoanaerobaculia bacterium]